MAILHVYIVQDVREISITAYGPTGNRSLSMVMLNTSALTGSDIWAVLI